MIKNLVRRLIDKATDRNPQATRRPKIVLPRAHQAALEEHLRRVGLRIERPNSHIPVLRHDQFNADIAGRRPKPRLDNNSDCLR